jgi:CRP/FNR family transcriptional regulator, cyclic AMP receptor protein
MDAREMLMRSPYGMDLVESCLTCKLRADHIFCSLPVSTLQAFESIKFTSAYPAGAVLFVEGEQPHGIFVLCKGRVKLSVGASNGKTLIVKIAEAGEVLGASATVSGKPYEMTGQTIDPCLISFVKRDDFLTFLRQNSDACLKLAEQLSEKYHNACKEVRSLGLSHSASERLARLLLEWSSRRGDGLRSEIRMKVGLTHEEIAQMIGTSRETVSRLFADMKKRGILHFEGATLVIHNPAALRPLTHSN